MAAGDPKGTNHNNGNSLLLYHYYQSFYSQKVVFALAEKNLSYRSHIVQLPKFEQYQPWFMRLNLLGEVPVLKDGVKIIPDSAMIIDYLEDNFSNGDTPRLQPEKGSTAAQRVKYFRDVLDKVPIEAITVGCLYHPDIPVNMKYPKFIQKRFKAKRLQRIHVLESMMKKHPELHDSYRRKLEIVTADKSKQETKEFLEKNLENLDLIFDELEEELQSHSSDWWLCSENFTVADISLSVLLHRLYILGLEERLWGSDQRPSIARYYQRLQTLDSFKRACLTFPTYAKFLLAVELLKDNAPFLLGAAVLIAAIAFGVAYFRKLK